MKPHKTAGIIVLAVFLGIPLLAGLGWMIWHDWKAVVFSLTFTGWVILFACLGAVLLIGTED